MIIEPADVYTWVHIIRRCDLSTKGLAASTADHIALVLASFANPNGTKIFPGVSLISKCAKVAEKTVRRALARLRELGLIEKVAEGSRHGMGFADEYRLTFPEDLESRVVMLDPDMGPSPVLPPPVTMTGGPDPANFKPADAPVENNAESTVDNPPPSEAGRPSDWGTTGHLSEGQRSSDDRPHSHHSHNHEEMIVPGYVGAVEGDRPRAEAVENRGDIPVEPSSCSVARCRARPRTPAGRRAASSRRDRVRHRCAPAARPPPRHRPTPDPATPQDLRHIAEGCNQPKEIVDGHC